MEDNTNYKQFIYKLLEQEASEEMMRIRQLILLRTALEGDIRPSRIPAPANITEVGGYYNLLVKQNQHTMLKHVVASALGLPADYAPDALENAINELVKVLNKK